MSEKTKKFIETVALLARNEYLGREKWILPSVCIAQAALESGWNLEAKTLFGIKGNGFTATTSEYYNGHYVQIQDSFKAFPNAASAVVGYYDFLSTTPRYAMALNNTDYRDAVDKLIHTTDGAPYATDPNYIEKIISIIDQYNLTQYDERTMSSTQKSVDEIAQEVINGAWGNGEARREALTNAGYDYGTIQERVNQMLGSTTESSTPTLKSAEEVAAEVIHGDWGDGETRREALTNAGYDYSTIQDKVNQILGAESVTPAAKPIDDIAKEVIRGEWGNGSERREKLEAAGYNYDEVQSRVNEMI